MYDKMKETKKNILFVCKWNRFRSRIAEAFFKKYNKNSKHEAKSAGVVRGHLPLDKPEVIGAKEFGIELKGIPRGLTSELMRWQDIIIIVADNVPVILFSDNKKHGKKTILWKIKDNKYGKPKEVRGVIKKIEIRVKKFINELEELK